MLSNERTRAKLLRALAFQAILVLLKHFRELALIDGVLALELLLNLLVRHVELQGVVLALPALHLHLAGSSLRTIISLGCCGFF